MLVPGQAQISKKMDQLAKEAGKLAGQESLSTEDVTKGLKAALLKGVDRSVADAAQENGFYANKLIKIPFPEDAKNVAKTLKKVGMEDQVNEFVKTLNRSAEQAAKEAGPIFVEAVKDMSVEDAWGILNGKDEQGATSYLKNQTWNDLTATMTPLISNALDETMATRLYEDLIKAHNKLPFVEKKNPDLVAYATDRTLDGLFLLIGQEEARIRKDPAARTSEILKKVFN